MNGRLLFASDLGVHTPYLLHHVGAIAQPYGDVVILHVIEPAGYMANAVAGTYLPADIMQELELGGIDRIIDTIKARIIDTLEEEFVDGSVDLSCIRDVRVVPGRAVDMILEQANSLAADLIVIGSHGQATVAPNMLGSVAYKLLQLSRIPVYMIPVHAHQVR